VSLREILGSLRDTTSKRDMLGRSGNCEYWSSSPSLLAFASVDIRAEILDRTDNAVIAANGFAADGKEFVKRVKQRLEVSFSCPCLLR
jgi:hypothetical protein